MNYGSVCSGIEAASVAWEPIGWKPAWFAEIEKFPSAVLAHHWPDVFNHGDMTNIVEKIASGETEAPDVLVGGTPCQAFSVAGLRNSLSDDRGQLSLEFIKLADAIDEQRSSNGSDRSIIVWENVPGVLSTKDNAFGCFLGALAGEDCELQPTGKKWTNAGCVYGSKRAIAWRVLDAQYFGVAQRRRRVFVVASARKGFDPAKVLFESEGVRRDSAPSREAGQGFTHDIAPSPTASGRGVERTGESRGQDPVVAGYRMVAFGEYASDNTASTMKARDYKDATDLAVCYPITDKATRYSGKTGVGSGNGLGVGKDGDPSPTLTAGDKHAVFTVHGTQYPCNKEDIAFALGRNNGGENAVFSSTGAGYWQADAGTLRAREQESHEHLAATRITVRRLTPVECERLQGFPDNHTRISWRNKTADQCPDGPRYKAIGNSMAVPVMRWIGERIKEHLS